MRIRSPQRKSFNTVPFLLTVFLLAAAPTSQLRATGSNTALFLLVGAFRSRWRSQM